MKYITYHVPKSDCPEDRSWRCYEQGIKTLDVWVHDTHNTVLAKVEDEIAVLLSLKYRTMEQSDDIYESYGKPSHRRGIRI